MSLAGSTLRHLSIHAKQERHVQIDLDSINFLICPFSTIDAKLVGGDIPFPDRRARPGTFAAFHTLSGVDAADPGLRALQVLLVLRHK